MTSFKQFMSAKVRRFTFAASTWVLVSLAASNAADAVVITPPGLNPGDKFNMVFVSNGTTTATSNDPAFYDAIVQAEAAIAGVDVYAGSVVQWHTLGSFENGPAAIERFNPLSPIYRLDGAKVADSGFPLFQDRYLQNPINVTPNFAVLNANVWTGSDWIGYPVESAFGAYVYEFGDTDVRNPFNDSVYTYFGRSDATDGDWMIREAETQGNLFHLYAFSDELTVVPEPATASALAVAAAWLLVLYRKDRLALLNRCR